jgi:cupin fold WbuC family metalloprotein
MSELQIIDGQLLKHVSGLALESARKRKNFNFHGADSDASHRLLNGIEPGSYIPPHRHLDPGKDETLIVLRGKMGAVFFDNYGAITHKVLLQAGGDAVAVNVPHGMFHTLVALQPGTVFFEAKAGPYQPLTEEERANWAPPEGAPDAPAYQASIVALFSGKY